MFAVLNLKEEAEKKGTGMSHPIHQANEESPYGDLTRQEFHKKHKVLHQQSFMLNKKKMKIFTQSWRPADSIPSHPKGLVAMVHGYSLESGWLNELTAVAIAKAGFLVCALDLQGHGCSDGLAGHIPKIEYVVNDCIQYFDSVKADHPKLPAFLYGESLGGAISILICLKRRFAWDGLILNGSMCGISARFKPMWPLEKLLPLAAILAPAWKGGVSRPVAGKSYKEEWKKKLVANNPNRRATGKPSAVTALEFLRVCNYIKRHVQELEVPLLMVHGEEDEVCDYRSASFAFESAASKDKTIKIFAGMRHMLIGEPRENVELVFGTILSWLVDHAAKAKR